MKTYVTENQVKSRDKFIYIVLLILNIGPLVWFLYFSPESLYAILFMIFLAASFLVYALYGGNDDPMSDHTSVMGVAFVFFPFFLLGLLGLAVTAFSLNFWIGFPPLILTVWLSYKILGAYTLTSDCYSCCAEVDHLGARRCPVCELTFDGNGWKGFKKHWNEDHSSIESYDYLLRYMCSEHKTKEKKKVK